MLAAREGDLESARLLMAAGADVNAIAGDGKNALGLAIFNGNYDLASFLVDTKSDVNKADTQRFTPLFWAVDRRNMETAPNFPWMVTAGSAAAHQEAARRRRQPERARQQHAARADARRLAAHRLRDGADARGVLGRPGAVEAAAVLRRRPEGDLERRRDDGRGRGRSRLHPGLQQGQVAGGAARGGQAVRRAGRRRQPGRRLRHHAADGRRQHGRHRDHPVPRRQGRGPRPPTTWARRTTAPSAPASSR